MVDNEKSLIDLVRTLIPVILKRHKKDFVDEEVVVEAVDQITSIHMFKDVDRFQIIDQIGEQEIFRFEEESKMLIDNQDHVEWLNPETGNPYHRQISWKMWEDYANYLVRDAGFSHNVVNGKNGIGEITNKILAVLDDPMQEGSWDRRGLVVGEVQSGKTANYIGLACKAADAGYKLIIILAGLYNDLRAQTQERFDEGFIGFDSSKDLQLRTASHRIGVGKPSNAHPPVLYYTNASNDGDFSKKVSQHAPTPLNYKEPIILVIKKNKSIIDAIDNWLDRSLVSNSKIKIIETCLLMIDDECDNASVNTRKFDSEDDEHDPTAINQGIRNILTKFSKRAYIGYTATPFANILMKRNDRHKRLGEDLFPRDFILNIPRPNRHTGPEDIFGRDGDEDLGIEEIPEKPLIIPVQDGDILLPDIKQDKTQVVVPVTLNHSLIRALKHFVLSSAARLSRGQADVHNSMLIHVTHYVNAHTQLVEHVGTWVDNFRRIISFESPSHPLWKDLESLWQADYIPVSTALQQTQSGMVQTWKEIEPHVKEAVERLTVVEVNGNTKDGLQYKAFKRDGVFKNFIAVGGNRLSRGLTLEGLTISYFLRASNMYDTLMQMGRWFGYRSGYFDLCRIFTTRDLINAYRHIALATIELRDEFDLMYKMGEKPEYWGMKIRSHPETLVVTGYGKRHWGTTATVTFTSRMLYTRNTMIDRISCESNLKTIEEKLLKQHRFELNSSGKAYIARHVNPETVTGLIEDFRVGQSNSWKPEFINSYINRMVKNSWLTDWTVVITNARDRKKDYKIIMGLSEQPSLKLDPLGQILISRRTGHINSNMVTIDRAVLNRSDEMLDFSKQEIREMNRSNLTPAEIRSVRPPERGLLLLYPLYGHDRLLETEDGLSVTYGLDDFPVFGAVISFPGKFDKTAQRLYVYDEKSMQIEIPYDYETN